MEGAQGEGEKGRVRIGIKTTVYFPEVPGEVELPEGTRLGDALWGLFAGTHFEGQVVDKKGGRIAIDDMWEVKVNDVPSYGLPHNLDTELHDGDMVTLSLMLLGGG